MQVLKNKNNKKSVTSQMIGNILLYDIKHIFSTKSYTLVI
jgi:hypothetical protein